MEKSKNNYYIPSIEEFHVGFEYENFVKEKGWTERKLENLEEQPLNENGFCLELEDYRVKFLDNEDIESLGWKFTPDDGDDVPHFRLKPWKLYWFITGGLTNINFAEDGIKLQKFRGLIRNKSELVVLMKQLRIVSK